MADAKQLEAVNIDPKHLAVDTQGHVTISDPKVLQMLKGRAGIAHGSDLSKAAISVGVVVSF